MVRRRPSGAARPSSGAQFTRIGEMDVAMLHLNALGEETQNYPILPKQQFKVPSRRRMSPPRATEEAPPVEPAATLHNFWREREDSIWTPA